MITTERLEELVNQEATAWGCDGKSVFDLPLKSTKDRIVAFVGKCCLVVDWYAGKSKGWLTAYYNRDNLYETKEQAEWALRTIGKRIEKFEPPMWEEIKDGYFFAFFQRLEDIIWEWQFEVIKGDCSNEGITFYNNTGDVKFQKPATKENYEKACEIVRDLFNKGDKE